MNKVLLYSQLHNIKSASRCIYLLRAASRVSSSLIWLFKGRNYTIFSFRFVILFISPQSNKPPLSSQPASNASVSSDDAATTSLFSECQKQQRAFRLILNCSLIPFPSVCLMRAFPQNKRKQITLFVTFPDGWLIFCFFFFLLQATQTHPRTAPSLTRPPRP